MRWKIGRLFCVWWSSGGYVVALDLQVVTKLKPVFMTWLKGKSDDHQGLKSSTYYLSFQGIINVITLL